ncbi:MAG: FAD:protein FMN transferase [Bdellovibrionota bacterium]
MMGSIFHIQTNTISLEERTFENVIARGQQIEKEITTYHDQSDIMQVHHAAPNAVKVGKDALQLIKISLDFMHESKGYFNPLLFPLTKYWRNPDLVKELAPDEIEVLQPLFNPHNVEINGDQVRFLAKGMGFDFGGIGKGYALDRMKGILQSYPKVCGILTLGRQVQVFGKCFRRKSAAFAVVSPNEPTKIIGKISISSGSIATSNQNEQFKHINGVRYGHIIDPMLFQPSTNTASAIVWAGSAIEADRWSTVMFLLGPQKVYNGLHKRNLIWEYSG